MSADTPRCDPDPNVRSAPSDALEMSPPVWAIVTMVALIGLNLRASLGALPPLLPNIDADLRISSTCAGLLTSVPVVCMGLCAPLGQRLASRVGLEVATGGALLLLGVAGMLRLLPGVAPLFITGAFVGGAMGAASALLPALIGHHLAPIRGLVTGIYSASLALGVAIAVGVAVPLERLLGDWRPALALWGVVAAATGLAWFSLVRRFASAPSDAVRQPVTRHRMPWRSSTARWVTYFLSSQMIIGFSGLAWIPPLYTSLGFDSQEAASRLVMFQLIQLATMLTLPALTDHVRDRRPLLGFGLLCMIAGLVLVLVDPVGMSIPAMLLFGAGVGGGSTLGLVLIVDSAADPAEAAQLGGMVLMTSFLCAACGPALIGLLSDLTGSLTYGFAALLCLAVVTLLTVGAYRPGRTVVHGT
jgi:CP family cyanate transporter-like MFS transporter